MKVHSAWIATLAAALIAPTLGFAADRGPHTTAPSASMSAIHQADMQKDIDNLASDDFEGRSPGTHGEDMTVAYLIARFKELGLAPGNPDGTYIEPVPMAGYTADARSSLIVGAKQIDLRFPEDFVAMSFAQTPDVAVTGSDLVFVGYGVTAPEYQWDDYKGMDVRGKTLVMLINDPPLPDPKDRSRLDDRMFGGRAMTYYGRWTYKYEMAAKLGAAAAIIIHETEPAAYPYSVVVNSWSKENMALRSVTPNPDFPPVAAWLQLDRARELFTATGRDFDTLKAAALSRNFRPVTLGAKVSFAIHNRIREIDSKNVIAKIVGSDPKLRDEYVIYSAHWDHFGWDKSLPGSKHDQIYHGAADNASGVAALLALAKGFKASPTPPKRTVLFIATTAEERGWLGARYYVQHPLYSLRRTLADINIDGINTWGRARDVTVIGAGKSTMDDLLVQAASTQRRVVRPDPRPEFGSFYRADQNEFAKVGVPVLFVGDSIDYIGKPAGYGNQVIDDYTAHDYHKVTDVAKPGWNLEGTVEDVQLLLQVGYGLAAGAMYPVWKPNAEFKAVRDAMMKQPE
jgi:Zn-dependent M28 family amino/carboxypeptidase